MGLERIAFLKQGVDNMYETDQVRPVLDKAVELSGKTYGANHEDDVRFRVVADHVRSSLMLMSDGVTPSNEGAATSSAASCAASSVHAPAGRRRADVRDLFATSRDAMKDAYPEVATDYARISQYAPRGGGDVPAHARRGLGEPRCLDRGGEGVGGDRNRRRGGVPAARHVRLPDRSDARDRRRSRAHGGPRRVRHAHVRAARPGESGRPLAEASARRHERLPRLRAKGETVFTGYTDLETESTVLGILADGHPVASAGAGQIVEVILAETALYAESGGQVADKGVIVGPGYELEVLDVQRPVPGLVSHTVEVTTGEVAVDQPATTVVDAANRRAAAGAFRDAPRARGPARHARQDRHAGGSLNRAGYLRFDFTGQALSDATKTEIEEIANNAVRDNLEVTTRVLSLDERRRRAR
jgi:alanyl-tRNA synthetase